MTAGDVFDRAVPPLTLSHSTPGGWLSSALPRSTTARSRRPLRHAFGPRGDLPCRAPWVHGIRRFTNQCDRVTESAVRNRVDRARWRRFLDRVASTLRREVRVLREEREILKKAARLRRLFLLSSGYYAWLHLGPSPRRHQTTGPSMPLQWCSSSTMDRCGGSGACRAAVRATCSQRTLRYSLCVLVPCRRLALEALQMAAGATDDSLTLHRHTPEAG